MIERISKKFTQFYQISLIAIMVCILGTIFYFWQLGFIDGSRAKELHKTSYILETFESKKSFDEIRDYISKEDPKLAITKTNGIENDFSKVNQQVETEEFIILKKDFQELKKSAARIISYSRIETVIGVFNKKMNKFQNYVERNMWGTLGRMGQRVSAQTGAYINKSKIPSLVKKVNREFTNMISITNNSIIPRKDKSEIVSRINNLQVEMNMLTKYIDERNLFYKQHAKTNKSILNWLSVVAPEVTLQKIQGEKIGRYYVMGLLGILTLVTSLFFGSFLFNKIYFRRAQEEIEGELEEFVSGNILDGNVFDKEGFSETFKIYANKMSEYFDKRMSFGSIFQDALPLSSILLDKNLKVLWANKQFCIDWEISEDEVKKDYMSWDFLNKLTNIGNDDPVLEALKHNVSGIYQVQIKPNDDSPSKPYEMFVSPVKFKNTTRIMLFFYDLTNLEQTITEQARCLVSPIHKSLSLMLQGQYKEDKDLATEFNIGGIDDIYEMFNKLNNNFEETETLLLSEIEVLHTQIESFKESGEILAGQVNSSFENSRGNMNSLKVFKDNVIMLSTLSRELDKSVNKGQEIINANINAMKFGVEKVNTLSIISGDVLNSVPKMNIVKEKIRDAKLSLYEAKSKLSHELAQLTLQMKRAHDENAFEKMGRTLNKVNSTFRSLGEFCDELDKRVSSFELVLSKAQLIQDESNKKLHEINTDYEVQQIRFSEKESKSLRSLTLNSSPDIENAETEIVASLQSIFNGTKRNLALSGEMSRGVSGQDLNT